MDEKERKEKERKNKSCYLLDRANRERGLKWAFRSAGIVGSVWATKKEKKKEREKYKKTQYILGNIYLFECDS